MTYNVSSGTLSLYTTTTTWKPLEMLLSSDWNVLNINHFLHGKPWNECIV